MNIEPGKLLNQYRLVEKIGEGGMGVVWKAVDTTLDREVAIKILPDAFAQDPDRRARFEREARLLATLNHPGIAGIYGLHEAEGVHFIAMEYVPGEDLSKRLQRGPLLVDDALDVARQVAEALEAAHDQGVIHRDLKPANIDSPPGRPDQGARPRAGQGVRHRRRCAIREACRSRRPSPRRGPSPVRCSAPRPT